MAILNDYTDIIEKDILVTEILDKNDLNKIIAKNVKIAIDVNGPFHFA